MNAQNGQLFGQMMDMPLLITSILRFAERNHGEREIVSVTADNPRHRTTYAEVFRRSRKLANALESLGVKRGERLATIAWNDYRHLEIYYGTSCAGFVCHTINPRLFADQLEYVINHAEDQWVFLDPMFMPLVEKLHTKFPGVKGYIVLTDDAHMPETTLDNVRSYESLIANESDEYQWPELDERSACSLCYTSGTTGNPKGVLYSHRSTVLHAYAEVMPDAFCLSSNDVMLPIVPMFHVNAWGLPYAAPMVGAKLVMPGPKMADGETLQSLIEEERVTVSGAVPTVWLGLVEYLRKTGKRIDSLERIACGGSAVPVSLMDALRDEYGVTMQHAWGMTEMSPLGTYNTPKAGTENLTDEARETQRITQGRGIFGVEMKITDDEYNELPWDGKAFGALYVRGPWVCSSYFKETESDVHREDGWFNTGDVATISPEGYMHITDRTKDVIKSGGEWISSIELENTAMGHPGVAEAAVIGVPHEKWSERPLLVVVKKDADSVAKDEILEFLEGRVAKWWIPSDVEFVDELPHTATGKVSKLTLRKQFSDYRSEA